jgi:hypothetical protein
MRTTDRTLVLSAVGCAAAALIFAATLVRALTVDATTPPEAADQPPMADVAPAAGAAPDGAPEEEGRVPAEEGRASVPLVREGPPAVQSATGPLTRDALMLAVENDPFQETRQRPPERYRMPGDPIEDAGPPPPPPPPPFQVLGTAQLAAGGLAIMQIEDSPPRVLAVGESLFGYTLERVEGEVATLTGQGRTLSLTVAQASPNPPAEEAARSSRDRRGRNVEEAYERLRGRQDGDAVRNLEQQMRGAEQGAIDAIRRMIEQRGNTMDAIPTQGGRVILRPRVRSDTNTAALPREPSRR